MLDADTYDTIEFAAMAFGGIGSGSDFLPYGECLCVHGMVAQFTKPGSIEILGTGWGNRALHEAGISRLTNDRAVSLVRFLSAKVRGAWWRISFAAWCKALGVVRGPHPTEQP